MKVSVAAISNIVLSLNNDWVTVSYSKIHRKYWTVIIRKSYLIRIRLPLLQMIMCYLAGLFFYMQPTYSFVSRLKKIFY